MSRKRKTKEPKSTITWNPDGKKAYVEIFVKCRKPRRAAKQIVYACSPAAIETLYAAVGRPLRRVKVKAKAKGKKHGR